MKSPITNAMLDLAAEEVFLLSSGRGPDRDSHAIIASLRARYPAQYLQALSAISSKDPVRILHGSIGRRLAGRPRLARTRRVHSLNVRGRITVNQAWRAR